MAQKNVNQETDERLGNVEEALSTTEKWIEDNQKTERPERGSRIPEQKARRAD